MLALALALSAYAPLSAAALDETYLPAAEFVPAPAGTPPCPDPARDCDDGWQKAAEVPLGLDAAAKTTTSATPPPVIPLVPPEASLRDYVLGPEEVTE
jgi:hypothetical protein